MVEPVSRALREKPYGEKDFLEGLNKELLPTLRESRLRLNELIAALDFPSSARTVTAGAAMVFGEMLRCDPTAGSITVTLPDPTLLPSRFLLLPVCVLIPLNLANSITLDPDVGNVNGTSSFSLVSLAATLIFCDGTGYWTNPGW
jgi:hypothetical protein